MPPGAKRTPCALIHCTALGRSSTHRPTWFSGVACTAGFLSGSSGCIRSTSTAAAPSPSAHTSSSTFSRSETKRLFTLRPQAQLVGAADRDLLDAEDAEGLVAHRRRPLQGGLYSPWGVAKSRTQLSN